MDGFAKGEPALSGACCAGSDSYHPIGRFQVTFARVNTVKSCIFNRAPNACNAFLEANRDVDMWEYSAPEFKKRVTLHVTSR